jgi:hypothetical protein
MCLSTRRAIRLQFKSFYEKVRARGYILCPSDSGVETFRVGCVSVRLQRDANVASPGRAEGGGVKLVAPARRL